MGAEDYADKPFTDAEEESENMLNLVESCFPPERCSLSQYRAVLKDLEGCVRSRIRQLDQEIRE